MTEPFEINTQDPRFDATRPVRINGYDYMPVAPLREMEEQIDAWSFNVMLECSGREDERLEVCVGGVVLDFRDLDRILAAVMGMLGAGGQANG